MREPRLPPPSDPHTGDIVRTKTGATGQVLRREGYFLIVMIETAGRSKLTVGKAEPFVADCLTVITPAK
jgi:hypothetical protein